MEGYPVTVRIPVAWGDMDAFGHVNNTVFFRYFETARIAYFEAIGYTALMEAEGFGPIVSRTECHFRRPLKFPDTVTVGARVSEVTGDRFVMEYAIESDAHGALAATGSALVVSYDYNESGKCPLPATIAETILELES